MNTSTVLAPSTVEQAGRKLVPCGGFPDATSRRVIFDW
jgi:hypothetical protein